MNMRGLTYDRPRLVNGRIVVDVVNEDGDLVLSGDAQWAIDTMAARGYIVENADVTYARLNELASVW
jgi:hypothetical protein